MTTRTTEGPESYGPGTETTNESIVVPLAAPEDIDRVGPIALRYADALDASVEVVRVIYPDDDEAYEFERFESAIDAFARSQDVSITFHLLIREDLLDGVLELCTGRWTCMRTSGSIFDDYHYKGSFASSLLQRTTMPVILVGPNFDEAQLHSSRVFVARSSAVDADMAETLGQEIAAVFSLPIATVTIDPKGIAYEADYDDERIDRPNEVHASMKPGPLSPSDVASTLASYADRGILVVTSQARRSLASICQPSVSLGAASLSHAPIVALGPAADLAQTNPEALVADRTVTLPVD